MTDLQQETNLWNAYILDRSDENRNAIVEFYYATVLTAVRLMNKKMRNKRYTVDEAVSDVTMRLMLAIPRFDPSKNVKFLAYFLNTMRIRGTILTGIKKSQSTFSPINLNYEDVPSSYNCNPTENLEFAELCEAKFTNLNNVDYEIAQAVVFEDHTNKSLARQLGVCPERVAKIRDRLTT